MRILVIRYRFIGDTILTVPFLKNLRLAYPDAQIDVLVSPNSGEVLETCPYVDKLIYFDTTRKYRYEIADGKKKSFWSYVWMLRKRRYDKIYVLKRSLSSAILAFLAGAKERIGFDTEKRGFLLTKKVPYDHEKHEIECFLDVLRAEGHNPKSFYLECPLDLGSISKINKLFKDRKIDANLPKVLVHATSGDTNKQWPIEYFAEIIEYLANRKKVQVFYIGTKNDSKIYQQIHMLIKRRLWIEPINLCGELSIQDSIALTKRMDFLVGNDSGNLHLAAAVNTPVIGIYGPMNSEKWRAWGNYHVCLKSSMDCVPCELKEPCPTYKACLYKITPEIVKKHIDEKLDKIKHNKI